jgi:hypothetical protein
LSTGLKPMLYYVFVAYFTLGLVRETLLKEKAQYS